MEQHTADENDVPVCTCGRSPGRRHYYDCPMCEDAPAPSSTADAVRAAYRSPTLAEELCEHVHPDVHAAQVFGACDTCKRYTLAVIESNWLRSTRRAASATALSNEERAALGERLNGDGFYTFAVRAQIVDALEATLAARASQGGRP